MTRTQYSSEHQLKHLQEAVSKVIGKDNWVRKVARWETAGAAVCGQYPHTYTCAASRQHSEQPGLFAASVASSSGVQQTAAALCHIEDTSTGTGGDGGLEPGDSSCH